MVGTANDPKGHRTSEGSSEFLTRHGDPLEFLNAKLTAGIDSELANRILTRPQRGDYVDNGSRGCNVLGVREGVLLVNFSRGGFDKIAEITLGEFQSGFPLDGLRAAWTRDRVYLPALRNNSVLDAWTRGEATLDAVIKAAGIRQTPSV